MSCYRGLSFSGYLGAVLYQGESDILGTVLAEGEGSVETNALRDVRLGVYSNRFHSTYLIQF